MITFLCVLCTLGVLCARDANAQSRRPSAAVTALTERARAHGGDTLRVALEVSLPEGLHTQSDKPRDPLLIPTSLTIDARLASPLKSSSFRHRRTCSRPARISRSRCSSVSS